MPFAILLLCLLLPCGTPAQAAPAAGSPVEVKAPEGTYQGHIAHGARFFPYIAYAEAPVGKRRWRRVPLRTKAAQRKDPVACPQTGDDGFGGERMPFQEDCLYLNVWSPAEAKAGSAPVVFFIHGGGLIAGNGLQRFYDGSVFARHGVVFVSFNYRLSELGYGPNLEKEKGSLGFMDQANALAWVTERISAFGGDPNRIFLMGQSKGAEAVASLLESGAAGPNVKGGIAFSHARHFDSTNELGIPAIQQTLIPGELEAPWEEVLGIKPDIGVYVPVIPSYREPGTGSHRFQLLTAVIYDERMWGNPSPQYCNQAFWAKQFSSYIDAYLFVLHAGRYEHGAELRSLFGEDLFGSAFRDYIVRFVHEGKPPHRWLSGRPGLFKDTLEVTHFFPWFSLGGKFVEDWDGVDCKPQGNAVGSQVSNGWLRFERILNFLGYGRANREFDAEIEAPLWEWKE